MVDYSKGKIYRLVCNTTGNQYIGSTAQSLSQRLGGHKKDYKRFLEGKTTKQMSSFSILCENNCEMILIEEFPCENKNQLERRERHFIETSQCVNKYKPAQTKEELKEHMQKYRQEHKEEAQKYQQKYQQENKVETQKYRQEHKEKIIEYWQKYQQEHKEEIKERMQKYRQKHKEESQKYRQKYRQENQEKLTILTVCECGAQYQHQCKSRHFNTLKHKNWLATHETTQ